MAMHKKIIDVIKNGSCYYAYYPDNWYTNTSQILNSSFDLAPSAYSAIADQNSVETEPAASSENVASNSSTATAQE
jgi:hypothetical protein